MQTVDMNLRGPNILMLVDTLELLRSLKGHQNVRGSEEFCELCSNFWNTMVYTSRSLWLRVF